ncbi:MAG: sporulation/spore germination protein [Goleter apudmare HA4340-LM2]|jgi:hypothetical protein|nr:sporulation/spore germination protein [Goleter apudmare HA4340-LM2]
MLNTTKRHFVPFILVAIAASLSSCGSNPSSRQDTASQTPNTISSPTPSQNPSIGRLRAKNGDSEPSTPPVARIENTPDAAPKAVTNKTTNVTLYTSDVQCQTLVPQKVSVSAQAPVSGSVGKILEQRDTGDFSLSGYRVNVKNGIATVDLRVAPQSRRKLASLSSCEQFALFGSLRKTLTSNPKWNIKQVRFTERGENVEL